MPKAYVDRSSRAGRPYTFVVISLLLLIIGPVAILHMPVDIFPDIDIPVITIIWGYGGLNAEQMSERIVTSWSARLTTTVNDIEHTESQTLNGISVIKVFFRPGANFSRRLRRLRPSPSPSCASPPGNDAAFHHSVQRLDCAGASTWVSGKGLSEQQLYDLGQNLSGRGWPRWRARRSRTRMAASSDRFRWIWITEAAGQGLSATMS